MKKFLYITIISFTLWSCGGGGGDTPEPTPVNKAPTTPTLSSPVDNALCIDNVVAFKWNASTDSNGDAITYQIQVATDNQFSQIAHTFSLSSTTKTITLEKGVAFYWRVKATDTKNASSDYSSVYQFYTEGDGISNHLPFAPTLVSPSLNEVVQNSSTTLQWNANDVDGDTLTYDVYFGTDENAATLETENNSTNSYTVNLTSGTNYYWKVVVKDGNGGQTVGQIWNFKTD